MVVEVLGSLDAAQLFCLVISLVGLVGTFVFSRAWWRRQPGFRDFDAAQKIGLEGYGLHLQLLSILLCVGGFIGFVLV